MTTYAPSNLPSSVNSLERLVVWSCGAFYQLNRLRRYQESDASPLVPIITAQDGLAADETERIIFRVSIPLNSDWRTSTTKLFTQALEVTNAAIPTGYLA